MTAKAERVTYYAQREDGSRGKRTVAILENIRETIIGGEPAIVGSEVDAEGAPVDRVHIVSTGCITRRVQLRMNNLYGMWEEVT